MIHRDIKPENILLGIDGDAKLADFGWSNYALTARETLAGTLEYLAPEMLNQEGHDTTLDVWCLGILLYELLVGKAPFRAKTVTELKHMIDRMDISFPNHFSPQAKQLVKSILKVNPAERLPIVDIVNHPWVTRLPELRPTVRLTVTREILPQVTEDSIQEFHDSECHVISSADQASKQLSSERVIRARLRTQIRIAENKLD